MHLSSGPEPGASERTEARISSASINGSGRPCVPSLTPPAELLAALSRVLTDLRLGWYVFRAQAVLYWGRPRLTEDIDVTVQLGAVDVDHLVTRLQQVGFALRVEATPAFISQTRVLPLVFGSTGWALDIVLAGPGLETSSGARSGRSWRRASRCRSSRPKI